MVSLFPFFSNQGGEDSFYRERDTSLPCNFSMWDCLPQKKKNHKPQNLGSTDMLLSCYFIVLVLFS